MGFFWRNDMTLEKNRLSGRAGRHSPLRYWVTLPQGFAGVCTVAYRTPPRIVDNVRQTGQAGSDADIRGHAAGEMTVAAGNPAQAREAEEKPLRQAGQEIFGVTQLPDAHHPAWNPCPLEQERP
jgi:hypothetical protein